MFSRFFLKPFKTIKHTVLPTFNQYLLDIQREFIYTRRHYSRRHAARKTITFERKTNLQHIFHVTRVILPERLYTLHVYTNCRNTFYNTMTVIIIINYYTPEE